MRCVGIGKNGEQCKHSATIGCYCMTHFKIANGMNHIGRKPWRDKHFWG